MGRWTGRGLPDPVAAAKDKVADAKRNATASLAPLQKAMNLLLATIAPNLLQIAPYATLVRRLKENKKELQANHLNQDAAYKNVIPSNKALAIPLEGDAFKDKGSPHYKFHESLETFWELYRGTDVTPTNGQYSQALAKALKAAGVFTNAQIAEIVDEARKQREAYGLMDTDAVPRIPDKINQK